jgi:hypothetical protein
MNEKELSAEVEATMLKAGLSAEAIYAYKRTGLIATTENWPLLSEEDKSDWQAAIAEFREGGTN